MIRVVVAMERRMPTSTTEGMKREKIRNGSSHSMGGVWSYGKGHAGINM